MFIDVCFCTCLTYVVGTKCPLREKHEHFDFAWAILLKTMRKLLRNHINYLFIFVRCKVFCDGVELTFSSKKNVMGFYFFI